MPFVVFFISALSQHEMLRLWLCALWLCGTASSVNIRPLLPSDLLPAARILLKSFAPAGGYNPVQSALIVAENVASLSERSTADNLLLVGCDDESEVIGFVEAFLGGSGSATLPDRLRQQQTRGPYVASLAVDASYRSRGVGEALMRECEARLSASPSATAADGSLTITLEVEADNLAALGLYRKLGYSVTSRDEDARKLEGDIFFGTSRRVTKLRLEKALEPQVPQQPEATRSDDVRARTANGCDARDSVDSSVSESIRRAACREAS